jgi:ketosteroid isomerase-like protein
MAASEVMTALVDQLIDLFNRRSLDLPDGSFTRHTQFLLNAVPFEAMLGRSWDDPLTLMLTRGPAGYRFTAKAVQHAVPDATLQRGEIDETISEERHVVRGQCWLSGHMRGAGEPVEVVVDVEIDFRGGTIVRVNATLDAAAVARIQEARLRA